MWTVAELCAALDAGTTSSRALVEEALARIADPAGEGARAFIEVHAEAAREEADFSDRLRRRGLRRSPLEGLPVSLKDLFDVAGQVTRAGSKVLADAPRAKADAAAVARLRAAGAVFIGRTNMVEFAFSGIGLNPHYGTPRNPYDRKTGRIPGGSSSGGAVAQADGLCVVALGSDTRGSIRGPAALCGVVGFKPTARRVPREGAFPLSYTLDSVGPLANSVACCAASDAILAGEAPESLPERTVAGLRLLVPKSNALEGLDREVERSFDAALKTLADAGAALVETPVRAFDRQSEYFKGGGFAGAEAYFVHRPYLERLAQYDPRVATRVLLGKELSAADYLEIIHLQRAFISEVQALAEPYDAIVMPSVPCTAPTIGEVDASDEAFFRWNARVLRNNGLVNFLDGCAITLPCQPPGVAPVGFMVCGTAMSDRRILGVAAAIERTLSRGD